MDVTEVLKKTRKTAARILEKTLTGGQGKTETEIRDAITAEIGAHSELFPLGWYDPPPGGIAVLFGDKPFARVEFETLRVPEFWPQNEYVWNTESVGMAYISPVDKNTGVFGDIGFSMYCGTDERIREHLKTSLETVLDVARRTEVGMRFCDLYTFAQGIFARKVHKQIGWMTTSHDPLKINLGHTVPGSYGDGTTLAASFDETKEAIRSRRIYINEVETFAIPATCAFTVEARLIDIEATLPNVFFHVIVTFSEGKKTVLTDFDGIFKKIGMEYML